jgi:hypothetical protein
MHRKRKRLKLAVVRPTTTQATTCLFGVVNNLRHNLLQNPVLTDALCIFCIRSINCNNATKSVWYP